MANCIAEATGSDKTRDKTVHRLGSQRAYVKAATWRTFAYASVDADGSGYVSVTRDGKEIHRFDFGPEGEKPKTP